MIYGNTHKIKRIIPYNSMESRKCTKCKKNKNGDEFNGMNRMCIECLDKQKESNKVYNQKEVFHDICQRNVKQCRLSKHLKTDRHSNKETLKKEEEKKHIYMEEYLKGCETRIAKLKHIWKTITPRNFKIL